jgi:hypothetical protein
VNSTVIENDWLKTKVVDMNPNKKIRVIKSARCEDKSGGEAKAERTQGVVDKNRAVAGRVGAWVREFQQRRIVDPRSAFASLFVVPGT